MNDKEYELSQIKEQNKTNKFWRLTITEIVGFLLALIIFGIWGCPKYNVYSARKEGEAQLAKAQAAKEVAVAEAKAKMESATYEAQADTTRARGIANANKIIGISLKDNPDYLKWLWIDNLKGNQNVIYIPTEANLPIMEAGKSPKYIIPQP